MDCGGLLCFFVMACVVWCMAINVCYGVVCCAVVISGVLWCAVVWCAVVLWCEVVCCVCC